MISRVPLSLVIPAHNVENLVVDTIESIKRQTLSPSKFEVVIFDDASTDNTHSVVQKQTREMENVRVYRGERNRGGGGARNQAIQRANGKYIALLDADDMLKPEALESTLTFMERNPNVRYSYSQYEMVDLNGKPIGQRDSPVYNPEILLHFDPVGAVICFDRKLHHAIGGYDESRKTFAEDWDHVLRADEFLGHNRIARNDTCLYTYRIHSQSVSNTQRDKIRDSVCDILSKALDRRGIKADNVFFSHKTKDNRSFYDWSRAA